MVIIMTLIIGAQVLIIGYLIRNRLFFQKKTEDSTDRTEKKKDAAKWTGNNLIITGAAAFILAGIQCLFPAIQTTVFFFYVLAVIPVLCMRIYLGIK